MEAERLVVRILMGTGVGLAFVLYTVLAVMAVIDKDSTPSDKRRTVVAWSMMTGICLIFICCAWKY